MIALRFTCGERKICLTIRKSQNIINMVVALLLFINIFDQKTRLDQSYFLILPYFVLHMWNIFEHALRVFTL